MAEHTNPSLSSLLHISITYLVVTLLRVMSKPTGPFFLDSYITAQQLDLLAIEYPFT